MNLFFKNIYNEIVYNGHLQSLNSSAIIIFSAFLFNIKITFDFLIIFYLGFYLIYLYNRYKEIDYDGITNKTRTEHIRKFYRYIPVIGSVISVTLCTLLFVYSNILFSLYFLAIIFFGILYSLYFKDLTRKVVFFKNLYVAIVFAIVVYSPFIYYGIKIGELRVFVLSVSIFVFLKAMVMQLFLDIKDIDSDKKHKLKTLGVLVGADRSFKIVNTLNILVLLLPILFSVVLDFWPIHSLFLLLLIPINYYWFLLAKNNLFKGYLYESGEFILWPILLLGNFLL